MNGKPADHTADGPGERFDPELAALFSEANQAPLAADTFVTDVLKDIHTARRRNLLRRLSGTVLALTAGAFAAPYVGEATVNAVDWLAHHVSTTEVAATLPMAGGVAALITWRLTRRAFQ